MKRKLCSIVSVFGEISGCFGRSADEVEDSDGDIFADTAGERRKVPHAQSAFTPDMPGLRS